MPRWFNEFFWENVTLIFRFQIIMLVLQGRVGHIDFSVLVAWPIFNLSWHINSTALKLRIRAIKSILSLGVTYWAYWRSPLEHKSQYALVDHGLLYQYAWVGPAAVLTLLLSALQYHTNILVPYFCKRRQFWHPFLWSKNSRNMQIGPRRVMNTTKGRSMTLMTKIINVIWVNSWLVMVRFCGSMPNLS